MLSIAWAIVGLAVLAVVVDWLLALRRGQVSIRDEDRRLRPVPAIGLSVAVVFAVGAVLAALLD